MGKLISDARLDITPEQMLDGVRYYAASFANALHIDQQSALTVFTEGVMHGIVLTARRADDGNEPTGDQSLAEILDDLVTLTAHYDIHRANAVRKQINRLRWGPRREG
jgi:hypothetical protein